MHHPLKLVIFGRQGSGKGTQCQHLVKELGVIHLSTGDILRSNIVAGTELGAKVEPILAQGGLVSDDIMLELVQDRLLDEDVVDNGFILDGFPRTVGQAKRLVDFLADRPLDVVLNLDVDIDEVVRRIKERGRSDDIEASIAERLRLYEQETIPAIEWFESMNLLRRVDGVGTEAEVTGRLLAQIAEAQSSRQETL